MKSILMTKRPARAPSLRTTVAVAVAALVCALPAVPLSAAGAAAPPLLAVELNKLETYDKGCRAYVVMNNTGEQAFQTFKVDLVLFQPDGVIARRFLVDLGPLKSTKKTVKLFDIEGLACDKIASVLVNDVTECKADGGVITDCLAKITLSSVAGSPLNK